MSLRDLFENNRRWARAQTDRDPGFFRRLAAQQSPQYLWIGCSDSRVPANEICGLLPGEMFVQRNVANVVVHSDLNLLSVLQFAVDVLGVRHVIVCGHYGCGGVRAALRAARHGLIDNWLQHVRDVHRAHRRRIDALRGEEARADLLCELNVAQQVANVCETTIVSDAWRRGQSLAVHGWVYRLEDGLLRDLGIAAHGPGDVAAVARFRGLAPAAARGRGATPAAPVARPKRPARGARSAGAGGSRPRRSGRR